MWRPNAVPSGEARTGPWLGEGSKALVLGAGAGLGQFESSTCVFSPTPQSTSATHPRRVRERALELGAEEAAAPEDLEGLHTAVLDFVGSNDSSAQAARPVDRQGIMIVIGLFGAYSFLGSAPPHEAHFMSSIWGHETSSGRADRVRSARAPGVHHRPDAARVRPRKPTISCAAAGPRPDRSRSLGKNLMSQLSRLPADKRRLDDVCRAQASRLLPSLSPEIMAGPIYRKA